MKWLKRYRTGDKEWYKEPVQSEGIIVEQNPKETEARISYTKHGIYMKGSAIIHIYSY